MNPNCACPDCVWLLALAAERDDDADHTDSGPPSSAFRDAAKALLALAATDEALRQEHLGHLAWQASHAAQESRRAGYGRHEDGVQRGDYTTPGCSSCERLRENVELAKEVGG